jgi:hypothetical protein
MTLILPFFLSGQWRTPVGGLAGQRFLRLRRRVPACWTEDRPAGHAKQDIAWLYPGPAGRTAGISASI